jgi:hypothetical protein
VAVEIVLDGVPSFVVKGCTEIFIPVLNFIFNLTLHQTTFPHMWKESAVVHVSKKGKSFPEDICLLVPNSMYTVESQPTFQKNMLSSSTG